MLKGHQDCSWWPGVYKLG